MANLDTVYTKQFTSESTTVSAVREAKVSAFKAVGNTKLINGELINADPIVIVNTDVTPILGTYTLSSDIARHFKRIEKQIVAMDDYYAVTFR